MKIYLKIIFLILYILNSTSCAEKITYSGALLNLENDIYTLNTKKELVNYLGNPNYIDPIEKKYFYYSEKKIEKNFYNSKLIYRKLFVFSFNSNDTIKLINEYDINNENQIKLVKDQTDINIIEQGILEKVFGGVGKAVTPTTQ